MICSSKVGLIREFTVRRDGASRRALGGYSPSHSFVKSKTFF